MKADIDATATWGRPPNFLLVDYYNYGNFPGSVFEVAAQMNNVTYNRTCCGATTSAATKAVLDCSRFATALAVIAFGILW
jgi:hypothetical protein